MGYIRHHAIVVASELEGHIQTAHAVAGEIFAWVSPISPPATNGCRSFFVPPDGSKEGWLESKEGDDRRDQFVSWLRTHRLVEWCEVRVSDENGKVLVERSSSQAVAAPKQPVKRKPARRIDR